MPSRKATAEIFLSHASRDAKFAGRLVEAMRDVQLRVFFSRRSIRGAQEWHDAIGDALARCAWFVIVLSPNAVASDWVKAELVYALNDRRYKGRIVPVLYRDCQLKKLSWRLASIQHIDFRKSFDSGLAELLSLWGLAPQSPRRGKARPQ